MIFTLLLLQPPDPNSASPLPPPLGPIFAPNPQATSPLPSPNLSSTPTRLSLAQLPQPGTTPSSLGHASRDQAPLPPTSPPPSGSIISHLPPICTSSPPGMTTRSKHGII